MKGAELVKEIDRIAAERPGFWSDNEKFYLARLEEIQKLIKDNVPTDESGAAVSKT